MLNDRALVQMLLGAGLLSATTIHAGLEVRGERRRHQVWTIRGTDGAALVVKQALTDDGRAALAREAMLYEQLGTPGGALDGVLPRLIGYDEERALLITALVDGPSLAEARGRTSTRAAAALGQSLAWLHRRGLATDAGPPALPVASRRQEGSPSANTASQPEMPPVAGIPVGETTATPARASRPPWILEIHRPTRAWYLQSSEASLVLRSLIQESPVIGPALDTLHGSWSPSALVHADLKLQHVIARQDAGPQPACSIAIVDWEAAHAGDPAWDTGTVIGGFLARWLRSIPLVSGFRTHELMADARIPLDQTQRPLRAFWAAYTQETGPAAERKCNFLPRSMAYAAARLIQLEEERLQTAPGLTRRTDLFLDVSENILLAPDQAATVLAGISPDREPA